MGVDSDMVFHIHDLCVPCDEVTPRASVRWLLDEMGYKWEEMEHNRTNTRCCGVGSMVCSPDPELYQRLYERRIVEDQVATYCSSCRDSMQADGKNAVHILDLRKQYKRKH